MVEYPTVAEEFVKFQAGRLLATPPLLKDFEAYAIEVLNLPDTVGSRVQVVKSLQSLAAGMIKNEFDKDIHDLVKLYFGVV